MIRRSILALGLALGLVAILVYLYWPRSRPASAGADDVPDPRLTYTGPFRNVRPDVKYLGDAACTPCHRNAERTYHQHSMGLSLAAVADVAPRQRYDATVHNPFDAGGRHYLIERQGDKVLHREQHRDAEQRVVAENRAEMAYAIGSGTHARSYLFFRGELLFQSPISWYTARQRWHLSPSYDKHDNRFERPVQAECLFCHCNSVRPIEDTLNRFETPLFPLGAAIGCERCHGPGELHVRERQERPAVVGVDHSIVNPRHLSPELREAVCQQCHLEGDQRILRRGRAPFDFRPGLPLQSFWSVFVPTTDLGGAGTFVGQVEQMHASRCFTQSNGKLGCITCHDPHALPAADQKPAYYRRHCVSCHEQQPCSLTSAERRTRNGDDCVACHMPRRPSADINHTAITDHRIPRRGEATRTRPLESGELPLVHFHAEQLSPGDPEMARDLGLALAGMARHPSAVQAQAAASALHHLEASLQRWPNDAPALEHKAYLLWQQGRARAALDTVARVLSRTPQRETALADAALYAEQAGDLERAVEYGRQAVALNPWNTQRRAQLATALLRRKEYDRAIEECRAVLEFNPGSVRIRVLLVSCYLDQGQHARAREEFEVILRLNPADQAELRRWFEDRRPRS